MLLNRKPKVRCDKAMETMLMLCYIVKKKTQTFQIGIIFLHHYVNTNNPESQNSSKNFVNC